MSVPDIEVLMASLQNPRIMDRMDSFRVRELADEFFRFYKYETDLLNFTIVKKDKGFAIRALNLYTALVINGIRLSRKEALRLGTRYHHKDGREFVVTEDGTICLDFPENFI